MQLGERIKQLRLENRCELATLAVYMGLSTAELEAIESNHRAVTHQELGRIAEAFGVSIDVFFAAEAGAQEQSVLIPMDKLSALLDEMKK